MLYKPSLNLKQKALGRHDHHILLQHKTCNHTIFKFWKARLFNRAALLVICGRLCFSNWHSPIYTKYHWPKKILAQLTLYHSSMKREREGGKNKSQSCFFQIPSAIYFHTLTWMCQTNEKWSISSHFHPLAFPQVTKGLMLEFCFLNNTFKG